MERSGAMTDMYDQALLGILQHVGNVQEFLNILFGFLYRKTDFYRLLMQPSDRLGFPPGVAKSMTVRVSLAGWVPLLPPRRPVFPLDARILFSPAGCFRQPLNSNPQDGLVK